MPSDQRRAAVLGSPIEHSLSPILHGSAYAALGLSGWTYERVEADERQLVEFVAGLGPEWAGLSVTMPGKRAALRVADEVSARAEAVGAANTLVHRADGSWAADCTDVDGVVGALRAAGGFYTGHSGLVLGAGGTAAATLAAFAELGLRRATIAVREPARAREAAETAERVGLEVRVERLDRVALADAAAAADVVVSTLPAGALGERAAELATAACVLDVVYHPWPTPLAAAVTAAGGRVATGLDMLLHQAFGQVEQFTGRRAPRRVMRDALAEATGNELPLPL
ncbi:shikimate dehydrogenase [Saccharopolyspora antimicrobica]|uniref:Shikimate dehydrogenase n=1 Tax=Saccharopolyspora antimicrobica TaxID=455193 RepID=A0ABX9TI75_9PSEU|nr:shikimate dehydrogenase [Saccharopolyspora antimicrobica]RKT86584.1 shikimate dehydrogenase [Saccharopolyspora antimicrobica]